MYSINNRKNKGILNSNIEDGLNICSKKKKHIINGTEINKISVQDPTLATPIATEIALKKYNKLVEYITNILIDDNDDEDPGESIREALNHIEKFRLEIKNKYRDFLKRKELEIMSKQLTLLKKELENKLIEIRENLINMKETKRSK